MPSLKLLVSAGTACLLGLSGYSYFTGSPWFYRHVVMPAVSCMDPERAHHAAVYMASKGLVMRDRSEDPAILVNSDWLIP